MQREPQRGQRRPGDAASGEDEGNSSATPNTEECQEGESTYLDRMKTPCDVFLMVRRKKLSIFTDAKDTTSVLELKKIIEGILKVPPENQQLYSKETQIMEDDKTLSDYGMVSSIAKAQCPATVGLAIKMENGEFEPLEISPLSSPPDLPYAMKSQEANGQEQTA